MSPCTDSAGAAIVVRLALRPGWLELVESEEAVRKFLSVRGFA